MYRGLGIFALGLLALPGLASASSHCGTLVGAGCACAIPLDAFDPGSTAILSNVVGDVDITTSSQYSPADPAVALNVGDGVLVAENSEAFLSFGPTCSQPLPAQSSLVIRAVDGCACASLVTAQTEATATSTPTTRALLAALGVGATAGVIYLIASQDDDEGDDEPVTPD